MGIYEQKNVFNQRDASLHGYCLSEKQRTTYCATQCVEAITSVKEADEWVADLDPFNTDYKTLRKLPSKDRCPHDNNSKDIHLLGVDFTSLDCWEMLLDPPEEGAGIMRARRNRVARLAAVNILCQQGHHMTSCYVGLVFTGSTF